MLAKFKSYKKQDWFKLFFKLTLGLFIISIPWQTRWIIYAWQMGDSVWEYGLISLYASEIILLLAAIFFGLSHKQEAYFSKSKFLYFLFVYSVVVAMLTPAPAVSLYYLFLIYSAALFAYLLKFVKKNFIFRMFLVSGLLESILAITQTLEQRVWANKWLGLAEHLPEKLGTIVIEVGDQRILRAYGSLPHPNVLGGFLFVTIFLGVCLWINFYKASEQAPDIKGFFKKRIWEFLFIILSLVLMTFGLLASFSRGAILALILSLFSVLIINIFKRQWLTVSLVAKYAVIFAAVLMVFNWWWPGAYSSRLSMSSRLEQKSASERVDTLDQLGWENYRVGFFGQGLGMNTLTTFYKKSNIHTYDVQPIHDIFLLMFAEVGVIGVFLLFNVVRRIIKSANQVDIMSTSLILGLVVIGLFDHYLWTSWTGWLLMSLALFNLYRSRV